MENSLKQIGERLNGLREVLDIPVEEIASVAGTSIEHYLKMEAGEADPSVYRLTKISKRYGIALDVLLFGEEPRMKGYFLTRRGQGLTVNRREDYKYQSLGAGFRGRKVEPFLVQVDPLPGDANHSKNSHDGQEFDVVIEGQLEITIADKVMTLSPGDSIYFDATKQHCMRAVGGQPTRFLCVVI